MTSYEFGPGNEAVRERSSKILLMRERIKKNIWADVSSTSRLAFQGLVVRAQIGNISESEFTQRDISAIHLALPAFTASLEEALVDRTMMRLLTLNKEAPEFQHEVGLFQAVFGGEIVPQTAVVDIIKRLPDEFSTFTLNAQDQGRLHVAQTVIKPDKLGRLGLLSSNGLFSAPTSVKNQSILMVPTYIPSTSLRYTHYRDLSGEYHERVEFVMEPL
jgi:hypothetical protein